MICLYGLTFIKPVTNGRSVTYEMNHMGNFFRNAKSPQSIENYFAFSHAFPFHSLVGSFFLVCGFGLVGLRASPPKKPKAV